MSLDVTKLNLFSQTTPAQGIDSSRSKSISFGENPYSSGGSSTSSKLFSGKTVGINDAVTGTQVFTAGQVGKQDGVLGSSFQAIA